jgi:cytochrome c553
VEFPLAWERILWRSRSRWIPRTPYALTDLRLVVFRRGNVDELTLYDIGEVEQTRSWLDRMLRTSTVIVRTRGPRRSPLTLDHIREGDQIAALLEIFAGEASSSPGIDAARTAALCTPLSAPRQRRALLAGLAGLLLALVALGAGLVRQRSTPLSYTDNDATAAMSPKRGFEETVRLMEDRVMPWARITFAPIVGGADRVRCETCHGSSGREQAWRMPAVAALPEEVIRERGWEHYSDGMDPQLRNAIYGYAAESSKQSKATYMREFVMPGMARLLERPAYDFTRTYDFNRRRQAFGCYHCHQVR